MLGGARYSLEARMINGWFRKTLRPAKLRVDPQAGARLKLEDMSTTPGARKTSDCTSGILGLTQFCDLFIFSVKNVKHLPGARTNLATARDILGPAKNLSGHRQL